MDDAPKQVGVTLHPFSRDVVMVIPPDDNIIKKVRSWPELLTEMRKQGASEIVVDKKSAKAIIKALNPKS